MIDLTQYTDAELQDIAEVSRALAEEPAGTGADVSYSAARQLERRGLLHGVRRKGRNGGWQCDGWHDDLPRIAAAYREQQRQAAMQAALEKWRTRWRRWLGNKTRLGYPHWTTLLDADWLGWVDQVFGARDMDWHGITFMSDQAQVKAAYARAINLATKEELDRLDSKYAEEIFERRHK